MKNDARKNSSSFYIFFSAFLFFALNGCSDFLYPVEETESPTEYSFNYWLLKNNYLYEEELASLPENGDSAASLYKILSDPYTRYVPPSKSEQEATRINTTFVAGDIGIRTETYTTEPHPIYISRVFYNGPADRVHVPRYGNIIQINGQELTGNHAKAIYDSVKSQNLEIELLIAYRGDTTSFTMQKETIYEPTVFVDTLFKDSAKGFPGIAFVAIEGFKLQTANQDSGTYGELRSYLDSTRNTSMVRVLDLRGNPGGHISQCLDMADLFVAKGLLSTRRWRTFDTDGNSKHYKYEFWANAGDPGESGKFLILANKGSASCSEIFIAAVTETVDIPFVGITTYGKGIGQTTWYTLDNGLAIITNTEFLTPKGNSYHGKGIIPKYECAGIATDECAAEVAHELYGVPIPEIKTNTSLAKQSYKQEISKPYHTDSKEEILGGALEWADSKFYRF